MAKQTTFFKSGPLSEYFEDIEKTFRTRIGQEPENYLLNINETDYIIFLTQEYSIDPISLDLEHVYITNEERLIPAERFPSSYFVRRGESYLKTVVNYHIPFTGNAKVLDFSPSTIVMWSFEFTLETYEIGFEIISFNDTEPNLVEAQASEVIKYLIKQVEYSRNDINNFNTDLPNKILKSIRARKEAILLKNKMLESLGVPIKKKDSIPATYNVPLATKKPTLFSKPVTNEEGFKPDPKLDSIVYMDILQTIHDLGLVFERLPSTYSDKAEEELRDHILLYLEPRYSGAASGETFNKSGKTDILIRYENENLFIAECKFWHGKKGLLDTISQLLNYLVWRDSKSAIVLFVKNKNFSNVLKEIQETLPKHNNFLGFVNSQNDTWFNYRFHINGDRNREVKLAVLVFHIP